MAFGSDRFLDSPNLVLSIDRAATSKATKVTGAEDTSGISNHFINNMLQRASSSSSSSP